MSVRAILLEQRSRTERSSRTEIQQFLEESRSKISELESQISELEPHFAKSQFTSFVERRNRESCVADVLRYLSSSIQSLPVELLVEVFALTICKERDPQSGRSTHFRDAYLVSHVCSDWRQAAEGAPSLWTGPVDVDFRRSVWSEDSDVEVQGYRTWLARSAPMSFPVFLTGTGFRNANFHPILEVLLNVSPRWRSLRLGQPGPAWFYKRLAEHALESLVEADLGPVADEASNMAVPFFDAAPLLRKLDVTPNPRLRMPWAQLSHLTLSDGRAPDISLDIVAQCTNVVVVSVDTLSWTVAPHRTDIITLSSLRKLDLDFYNLGRGTHFMPFLASLSAPVLTDLSLYFGSECLWMTPSFVAFQQRSPNLTSLQLCFASLTSADLRDVLAHAPLLSHLKLHFCPQCIDDDFVLALYYKSDDKPLVPLLRKLFLTGISTAMLSENRLVGMIASRWWSDAEEGSHTMRTVARWTHVELRMNPSPPKFSPQFGSRIEDLKRKGLHVVYSGGTTGSWR
ncbi:hypothetical protein C8R46DRAFT_1102540 [Mycena filopes]|nr:hypothetical protein C8R46DRAFT_1102540 [Mycena filopes]